MGSILVKTAEVTDRGLKHDRRWMLIDENNRFISQREAANMVLLVPQVTAGGILITHKPTGNSYLISFLPKTQTILKVTVWDDTCHGVLVCPTADAWFSAILGLNCRLVYMPDNSHREVDPRYATQKELTSFADAYPFLLAGQASIDELNSRLRDPVSIDRFRPNIVFTGGVPFSEDDMTHFKINDIDFYGVKRCARCVMITINQQNAAKNTEPLKTLAGYRFQKNKILFGQNLLHSGGGYISVGDEIKVIT